MKPNRFLRLAAILWGTLVLCTAMLTPGALAKYRSTATGAGAGQIAKWSVTIDSVTLPAPTSGTVAHQYTPITGSLKVTNGGEVKAQVKPAMSATSGVAVTFGAATGTGASGTGGTYILTAGATATIPFTITFPVRNVIYNDGYQYVTYTISNFSISAVQMD